VQVPMVTKVQKVVDVPQVEFIDTHVHVPVMKERQVPAVTKVQRPVEVTVIETVEKIVDVPVVKQIEVPQVQTIEKIVEVPYIQTIEKIVEIPTRGDTVQGTQTTVTIEMEPQRQEMPAEVVQEVHQGPPLEAVVHPAQVVSGIMQDGSFLYDNSQTTHVVQEPIASPFVVQETVAGIQVAGSSVVSNAAEQPATVMPAVAADVPTVMPVA